MNECSTNVCPCPALTDAEKNERDGMFPWLLWVVYVEEELAYFADAVVIAESAHEKRGWCS